MVDAPAIPPCTAVLTTDEMYAADAAAVAAHIASLDLMEAAGTHAAREIRQRWTRRRTAVLCGPGNNGGDGFVIARLLKQAGWPVRLGLLGDSKRLRGDAAVNAQRWTRDGGHIEPLSTELVTWGALAVDALFGAGLSKPLSGVSRDLVQAINDQGMPCMAVDVPSGVNGNTGAVVSEGVAPSCDLTVTFFRPKPGHLLRPGRDLCGDLAVVDIGIPDAVLNDIGPKTAVNGPDLWTIPQPGPGDHKYTRGHAVVFGSAAMSGAARLGTAAARRVGAGLVTVVAPVSAAPVYADGAPGVMFQGIEPDDGIQTVLGDARRNAVLIGPGHGISPETKKRVLDVLNVGRATVLDADALTSFADDPEALFEAIKASTGAVVLTPHEGEFARLFSALSQLNDESDRLSLARAAATKSGAVVLLKGSDTVTAAPDGRAAISVNAPSWLATGGSGDVLAGLITGLLAQGMAAWPAACAGNWVHAAAARSVGRVLIAEDLLPAIADVGS